MGATLCRDKNGKPHIDGCNWHFNVSHSHSYVAVALSDRGDVGVDIENTAIEAQKAIKMAQRFFTEDEQACVESQPASFHDVWSAKEAIAKYYGMPLGELIDISKHKPTLYLELLKRIKTQKFDINGCAVTLCVSAAENDIRLIN